MYTIINVDWIIIFLLRSASERTKAYYYQVNY